MTPLYPVLRRLAPRHTTTSLRLGQAMIDVCRGSAPHRILTRADINDVATGHPPHNDDDRGCPYSCYPIRVQRRNSATSVIAAAWHKGWAGRHGANFDGYAEALPGSAAYTIGGHRARVPKH